MARGSARAALVEAVLDHLLTTGCSAVSLRSVADAVGVSHSLLIYHFQSLISLLSEVHLTCEQRLRSSLIDIELSASKPVEIMRLMWRRSAEPAMWPLYRLTFELRAREDVPRPDQDAERQAWLTTLEPLVIACGVDPDHRSAEALLWLAACRGLLWELVCGADPDAVDDAAEMFFLRYDASFVKGTSPARPRRLRAGKS